MKPGSGLEHRKDSKLDVSWLLRYGDLGDFLGSLLMYRKTRSMKSFSLVIAARRLQSGPSCHAGISGE